MEDTDTIVKIPICYFPVGPSGAATRENITDGVHSMKSISIFNRKKKNPQISSIY